MAVFLTVYVTVALLNHTLTQSLVASAASDYLTRECGGKVKIGSMGCNPLNHLVLRNVELIAPDHDTICMASKVALRFKNFPYDSHGLTFSYVKLKDTYYHLAIDTAGINLRFIIDRFASEKKEHKGGEFKVVVADMVLDNVRYKQDLKDLRPVEERKGVPGVDVKHMEYRDIKARFRNVRVDKDFVTCRIDRMTTKEKSGLEVKEMHMNVYATHCGISVTNMHLETADSRLMGDVLLDFPRWKTMSHFLDSVYLTCHFTEGSYGNMRDAAYWAHTLWGMDERVYIEGWFAGVIADFHADDVHLSFGKESTIDLDAHICGLPKIDSTLIDAKIHKLHTTYDDLAAVRHPNGVKMKADKLLRKLEYVDLTADFKGTINDFGVEMDLASRPGDMSGDVEMTMNRTKKLYTYKGMLKSDGFHVGRIAPNKWVSRTGFDLSFEGSGFDPKSMTASLEGRLNRTVLKGQRIGGETAIDVVAADGKVVADVNLDDETGRVVAHGEVEWRGDNPVYLAQLDAEDVDLKRFGLWNDTLDKTARLDARMSGRYSSRSEGNSYARISMEDVNLTTTTKHCAIKNASLTASELNYWKNVTLRSDVADAQMTGYFKYGSIGDIVSKMREYVPTYRNGDSDSSTVDYEDIADARFDLNVVIKDTVGILKVFVPKLTVAKGTSLQANYNFAESLKSIIRSDSIGWGGVMVYNVGVNSEGVGDIYKVRMTSDEMKLGGLLLAENSDVGIESSMRGADCHFYWENSSQSVGGGNVKLRILSDTDRVSLLVDPSRLALGGEEWRLTSTGSNYVCSDGLNLGGVGIESGTQRLWLTAMRMGTPGDSIQMSLSDFSLGVVNSFLGTVGLSLDGEADGNVRIDYLWMQNESMPYLNADMTVRDLKIDDESLGDARIRSTWNADMNQLNLYMTTETDKGRTPLQLSGYTTLGGSSPELNFSALLDGVGLKTLEPLTASFSSEIDGTASAEMEIGGTLESPNMRGWLSVEGGRIRIDMLNVSYMLSDTIHFDEDAVRLENIVIRDEMGNNAVVNGMVSHNHMKKMELDIDLTSDKLLCMNTKSGMSSVYYGKVLAAVEGSVTGEMNDLDIVLNATTLDGTVLHVPIDDKRELKEANYIHFVSEPYFDNYRTRQDDEVKTTEEASLAERNWNYRKEIAESGTKSKYLLTINVETTPDMQMHLPMDFSTIGADVKVRGGGDLQLMVGTERPFTIIGDYEIDGGTVSLDLLSVLSKDFTVDEGGSITFPGTVNDAVFDIQAVYSQRVNMSTLTGTLSSTESQKSITVENVIALSGTLQSPNIDFDIRLPGADQSVQEEVFAYIDRDNERDMLNQTVSLLLTKKFYNMSVSTTESPSTSAASEAYGFVANTLGSVVSDMVDFVDVGFAYQAGNEMWREQYELDISKQWNKFYFESTFGFGGESREMMTVGGNNNMTGDMLVGYKINPQLHLFVFNRSNTNDYTRSDLPYKQGLGVKYTRDFDSFKELFTRKNKKNGR